MRNLVFSKEKRTTNDKQMRNPNGNQVYDQNRMKSNEARKS